MFPMDQKMPFQTTPMEFQDSTMMFVDQNETTSQVPRDETETGGGISQTEFALFHTKRLQTELQAIGTKIRQHEAYLISLTSQKTKLDESILDLQVQLSIIPRIENYDTNLQGQDIDEQILQHESSAAGVVCLIHSRHNEQASTLMTKKGVIGVVAKLGKVNDENLSQVLSDYLGIRSMLAFVCKNSDSVNALASFDNQGNIDENAGLHGLGSSIGKTIKGQFDVICLENLRPYVGQYLADDPQRRLDLLKPKLPNGEIPTGFVGFAVNMIEIDPVYLLYVTNYGYGLRETLFYSLFSRLQVYKTRVDMINALPFVTDGAISLDGGIIRTTGIYTIGGRGEVNVRFAKASRTTDNYSETEGKLKQLKWKKEKAVEDMKREQVNLDQASFNFAKKKEEFVRFLAQNSSPNQQTVPPIC